MICPGTVTDCTKRPQRFHLIKKTHKDIKRHRSTIFSGNRLLFCASILRSVDPYRYSWSNLQNVPATEYRSTGEACAGFGARKAGNTIWAASQPASDMGSCFCPSLGPGRSWSSSNQDSCRRRRCTRYESTLFPLSNHPPSQKLLSSPIK